MAANFGRTKPSDPLWYRADRSIIASCPCGRRVQIQLGALGRRIDSATRLHQVAARLVCEVCGRKGPAIELPR